MGRMKFAAYGLFVAAWSLLVYSPLAHWVWGRGLARRARALDFAGGTVVHVSAGFSALVAAIVLGRRAGHGERPHRPHNVPFVLLGARSSGSAGTASTRARRSRRTGSRGSRS